MIFKWVYSDPNIIFAMEDVKYWFLDKPMPIYHMYELFPSYGDIL